MPTLERDGARIAYDVQGDGPPVLLGHSLLCDGRMWEAVVPTLARRHRVINIDARGHRGSSTSRPFTFDDLVGDWLAIMDREKIDRAALCGLSMGGMTAMRLALVAPERVTALGLLDTSPDPELLRKKVQYRAMAEILRRFGHVRLLYGPIEKVMFGRTTRRERPALVARERERIREHQPAQLYEAVRAVIGRGTIFGRLGEIRCPTLILCGEEDAATPPWRSRRLVEGVPGATLKLVPRAGHLSAIEAPEIVARELADFLGACAQRKAS